jgi:hypothetical protein
MQYEVEHQCQFPIEPILLEVPRAQDSKEDQRSLEEGYALKKWHWSLVPHVPDIRLIKV